jgi:hypothetical protein
LATRPLRAGAPLVRVPRAALLTAAEARRCASCGAVADAADASGSPLSEWQLLCLALLHQRALRDASAWAPYLAVLPPQPRSGDSGGGDATSDDLSAFLHPLLWPTAFAERVLAGSPMLVRFILLYARVCVARARALTRQHTPNRRSCARAS